MSERGNWRDFVTVAPIGAGVQHVKWNNGVLIGELVQDVDGYWKYGFTSDNRGLWDAYVFEILAEMMNELNKPWDDEITKYFEEDFPNDPPPELEEF